MAKKPQNARPAASPALSDVNARAHFLTVEIVNQRGLHARASAKFVNAAQQFNAQIMVEKDGVNVSGVSIMGLLLLAAGPGDKIKISTAGVEATDALEALARLVGAGFNE